MGILLQKQPLYIKGPHDPNAAAQGCYQGAAIYIATFVVSFAYWTFDDMKNGRGMLCRKRSPRPANSSLDQAKYGGKYGAVRTNI